MSVTAREVLHVADRLRLMAVHAHPDDESSKGAATMAKYVAEGRDVLVVSCTGGERGDVLNPRLKDDAHIARDLPRVRQVHLITFSHAFNRGALFARQLRTLAAYPARVQIRDDAVAHARNRVAHRFKAE